MSRSVCSKHVDLCSVELGSLLIIIRFKMDENKGADVPRETSMHIICNKGKR
ncbi:hypothetical protein [Vibrio gallaecicus]|uniref:hypothetical protein n=1 Tax=Vibrio gallaecicus TaxID=552386 RepID=UPI0025B2BD18|nr:hypothetical protein [Vibrio gallaecicus]MDN3615525.1 hypothetical protein [Vibrio gallaecicus]